VTGYAAPAYSMRNSLAMTDGSIAFCFNLVNPTSDSTLSGFGLLTDFSQGSSFVATLG
jgi:hypothetical protein